MPCKGWTVCINVDIHMCVYVCICTFVCMLTKGRGVHCKDRVVCIFVSVHISVCTCVYIFDESKRAELCIGRAVNV